MIRGPKSLAGFKAKPVVPPMEMAIAVNNNPIISGLKLSLRSAFAITRMPNTKKNVPIVSLRKLALLFLISEPVTKTDNFACLSSVSLQ